MALEYIKVFYDWEEATEALTFEERGRLIVAMLQYAKGKDMIELSGNERFLFPMCKNFIDRAQTNYDVVVERNRKNGVLGGRPKTTQKNQWVSEKANTCEKSQEKDKEKDKYKEKYKEKEETKHAQSSFDVDDLFEAAVRRVRERTDISDL